MTTRNVTAEDISRIHHMIKFAGSRGTTLPQVVEKAGRKDISRNMVLGILVALELRGVIKRDHDLLMRVIPGKE